MTVGLVDGHFLPNIATKTGVQGFAATTCRGQVPWDGGGWDSMVKDSQTPRAPVDSRRDARRSGDGRPAEVTRVGCSVAR